MRIVVAILLVALIVAVIASFALAPGRGWWLPVGASTYSGAVDGLFMGLLSLIGVAFVITIALLAWCVLAGTRASRMRALFTHGNAKLELAWTVVLGAIFAWIAFAQLSTWNALRASPVTAGARPFAEVWASQFDWRFRYAGGDGRFGTADDFETPYELVVPVGEPIVLALRSRDVIHSFFVPSFRLKQDVVPGATLSAWFEGSKTGRYDVVCAQLCGFGHYTMTGSIRVVTRSEYEAWVAEQERQWMSNGQDERR